MSREMQEHKNDGETYLPVGLSASLIFGESSGEHVGILESERVVSSQESRPRYEDADLSDLLSAALR
jgi:hypothetical protein